MNVCGIICEYNPFHNGHIYHIEQTRLKTHCDVLVCVMSGNIVQRGEMAICDKWKRARAAIEHGCDLVVELPFPFVVQSADRFAHGAVHILSLAKVNAIVFGSESNHLQELIAYSKQNYDDKTYTGKGISHAKALELSLGKRFFSNDILGIFYIKEAFSHDIQVDCIKRSNGYHDTSIEQTIASASAIRNAFYRKESIKHTTPMDSSFFSYHDWNAYYPYLQHILLTHSKEQLASLFLVDEGIESLLKKQAYKHFDFESFMEACTSKRYTRSSIQRTLIHILTQTQKAEINTLQEPDYVRPLAFNETGKQYLRSLQDQGVFIASSFKQIPDSYQALEYRATFAYATPFAEAQRRHIIERELLPMEIIV